MENMTARLVADVTFQPGVFELLDELSEAGIPIALVTSSVRAARRRRCSRSCPAIRFITRSRPTTSHNLKPHPEPYLTALELLGVDAEVPWWCLRTAQQASARPRRPAATSLPYPASSRSSRHRGGTSSTR